ncbi:MAG: hypothetical protein PVI92_04060 [Chromatiales bacterium]|jgi:hypothetical protein
MDIRTKNIEKYMFRIFLIIIALFLPIHVNAAFLSGSTISLMFGSDNIKFAVNNAPTGSTCTYYNRHFTFDATTDSGKNMLLIILAAHMSGKKVALWYKPSSAPGSNQNSGCNESSMAILTAVGFD